MAGYFNFWDPLERRYVFNSFLVVVALVEVLIFVVTLIWQIDEGMLGGPVRVVPFPWKEYLFAAFTAPLILLFLFGVIVRGFQAFGPDAETGPPKDAALRRRHRFQFFLSLAAFLGLVILWFYGREVLALAAVCIKTLGLGGTYLLVAVVALAALYFPIRLILNYRLQKKALEYKYLQYLADHHGIILSDLRSLEAPGPEPGDTQASETEPPLPPLPPNSGLNG